MDRRASPAIQGQASIGVEGEETSFPVAIDHVWWWLDCINGFVS